MDQIRAAIAAKDYQAAYLALQSRLSAHGLDADGWYLLGHVLHVSGKWAAAAEAFRRALADGKTDGWTWTNFGWNLHLTGDPAGAEAALRHAIAIDPGLSLPHTNLSQALICQGRLTEGLDEARRGVLLSGGDQPPQQMGLAFALLFNRFWAEGLRRFEARVRFKFPEWLKYPIRRWAGEPVRHLFIQGEQGFGDTLLGLRWLPAAAARAETVSLYVSPELRRLVSATAPANVSVSAVPKALPDADAWSPLFSLPTALGLSDSEIVALPDPGPFRRAAEIHDRPSIGRPSIGLCWAGSPSMDMDPHRSIPLATMARLLRATEPRFSSLQVGPRAADLAALGLHGLIEDLAPRITDFADTAASVRSMDLVITADTAVAHLAGSLGVPVWVVLGDFGVYWPYGVERKPIPGGAPTREASVCPFYPSMRLFRRRPGESWDSTVDRVSEALKPWLKRAGSKKWGRLP